MLMRATKWLLVPAVLLAAVWGLAAPARSADPPAGGMAAMAMGDANAPMPMPMMHMKMLAEMKTLLEQAKGAAEAEKAKAAEAEKAKAAEAKIDAALKLLDQQHQAMHNHMAQMRDRMAGRMSRMKSMMDKMQQMRQEMGKSAGGKPAQGMMGEMDDMGKKMRSMRDEMGRQGGMAAADEKCPLCGKTMAAQPKVVNSTCPIMGGKVDRYSVPDNLTRQFEGKNVGFCCANCPAAWDKLSKADKEAKLKAITTEEKK